MEVQLRPGDPGGAADPRDGQIHRAAAAAGAGPGLRAVVGIVERSSGLRPGVVGVQEGVGQSQPVLSAAVRALGEGEGEILQTGMFF